MDSSAVKCNATASDCEELFKIVRDLRSPDLDCEPAELVIGEFKIIRLVGCIIANPQPLSCMSLVRESPGKRGFRSRFVVRQISSTCTGRSLDALKYSAAIKPVCHSKCSGFVRRASCACARSAIAD